MCNYILKILILILLISNIIADIYKKNNKITKPVKKIKQINCNKKLNNRIPVYVMNSLNSLYSIDMNIVDFHNTIYSIYSNYTLNDMRNIQNIENYNI